MTRATGVEARASASDFLRLAAVTTATQVLAVNGKVMSWHPVIGLPTRGVGVMADPLTCRDCPKAITRKNRTGRCIRCASRARWSDPAMCASHKAGCKRGAAKRVADPAKLDALKATMLETRKKVRPDQPQRANEARMRTVMGWCPEQYRDLNRQLRNKGILLPERKQMIATEMLREAERSRAARLAAEAAKTPFERQLERVRNGAKLVVKPDFRRPDPAYTLGGVAPEAV